MKSSILRYLIFVFALFFAACSGNQKSKKSTQTAASIETTINQNSTSHSQFAFEQFNDTRVTDKFVYEGNKVYTDSTKKRELIPLTKAEKFALLGPFIKQELKLDPAYVRDWMNAWFVAKQDKIGGLQPVIIRLDGDDYGAVTMILLDDNNRYVGGCNISGGEQPGPTEVGDSLEVYSWKDYAVINKNVIINYQLERTDYKDKSKHISVVDSVVYRIKIDNKGQFNKSRIGSTKYTINN